MPEIASTSELRPLFDKAVHEITGHDISAADNSTPLSDIDIDSLDLIEIGMLIEQQSDTVIDSAYFDGVETIADVLQAVSASLDDRTVLGTDGPHQR